MHQNISVVVPSTARSAMRSQVRSLSELTQAELAPAYLMQHIQQRLENCMAGAKVMGVGVGINGDMGISSIGTV